VAAGFGDAAGDRNPAFTPPQAVAVRALTVSRPSLPDLVVDSVGDVLSLL
jgi:hypothetical protein